MRTMSESAQKLIGRVRVWGPTLGRYTLVQLVIQFLGALAGLLIVRTLPKQEYAFYTLANTMIPTVCTLAASGISYAASALGGRVWTDRRKLGQVAVTAFEVSRVQALLSALPALVIFAWLFHRNGAPPAVSALLLALGLGAAVFQFASGIFAVVPRLRGNFEFLQRTDLVAAMLRLVLIATTAWLWLDAAFAVLIGGLANAIRWLKIRSWTRDHVDLAAPSDPSMAAEMRRAMWRQWPNEIYYVTQGHISLYLLSIFGSVTNVADFGALGRIGIVFTGPIAAMQNIAMPRFARCQDATQLRRLYIEIFAANAVIAVALVAVAFAAPRPILWLLGARYSGLDYEFLLYAVSLAIGMLSDTANGLNVVRAWIIPSWILVPTWVATQVLLMAAIGVSSLAQVLWISILTNTVLTCVYLSGAAHFGRAFARSAPSVRVS